ncbi:hypothetical protein E2R25_25780 [Burkholderia pseudomallei]|nr:hypothetical protein E2R28_25730 [Burkholderia pseudomallei]QBP71457.1 hypothetical protein E2R25_25780 [Burkholderia pseudomallei]QBR26978.1 hypothetical protein E3O37_26060 [Burkholderia pseudomallei]
MRTMAAECAGARARAAARRRRAPGTRISPRRAPGESIRAPSAAPPPAAPVPPGSAHATPARGTCPSPKNMPRDPRSRAARRAFATVGRSSGSNARVTVESAAPRGAMPIGIRHSTPFDAHRPGRHVETALRARTSPALDADGLAARRRDASVNGRRTRPRPSPLLRFGVDDVWLRPLRSGCPTGSIAKAKRMKVRAHRAPARQVSPGRRPRQSGRRCTRRSPHALSARPILLPCAARHGTPATLAAFGRMGSRPLVHSRRHAATTIFQSGGIAPHRTSRFAERARSASRAPAHPTRRMRVRQRHAHRS